MKVLTFDTESRAARVQLSRRNLEALLSKLNYNRDHPGLDPADRSSVTLISPRLDGNEPGEVWVTGVEDAEHYADRPAGSMLDNESGEVY